MSVAASLQRLGGINQRAPWRCLLACLAFGALASVLLRQDINWDLLNYHWYNPWAWLHDRLHIDLAAAGPQTYFNPLLDLPYYALASGPLGHWPRVIAAVQGLWYGGLIFVVWRIVVKLARAQARALDWGDLAALLIGISGSAAIAQVGTTFNELPLAVAVLAALALLLPDRRANEPQQPRQWARRALLAGALAGLAAGLKPTATIYLPALGLAVLFTAPRGRRWASAICLGTGAALAFALAYGWWGLTLYRSTGNPFFPLFNNLFHSDWVAAASGMDVRFRPHDAWQWVFYPFYWTVHRVNLVSENSMLDGRFAFAWLAGAAMGVQWLTRALRRPPGAASQASHAGESMLLWFVLIGYLCWLVLFSIIRYAIPIEALTGVVMAMAVRRLRPGLAATGARNGRKAVHVTAMALAVLVLVATQRPSWGRVDFGAQVCNVQVPAVPDHSLILMVDQPHTYLAPFFQAQDLSFVGVTWFTAAARGHRLWAMTQQRIDDQRGPMFAVLGNAADPNSQRGLLPLLGLQVGAPCRAIFSNLEPRPAGADPLTGVRLCPLSRLPH